MRHILIPNQTQNESVVSLVPSIIAVAAPKHRISKLCTAQPSHQAHHRSSEPRPFSAMNCSVFTVLKGRLRAYRHVVNGFVVKTFQYFPLIFSQHSSCLCSMLDSKSGYVRCRLLFPKNRHRNFVLWLGQFPAASEMLPDLLLPFCIVYLCEVLFHAKPNHCFKAFLCDFLSVDTYVSILCTCILIVV